MYKVFARANLNTIFVRILKMAINAVLTVQSSKMLCSEITVLLLFILTTSNGVQLQGRIVGGKPAPISKFPYQVSLQYFSYHICGGAIISSTSILTAAHCVYELSPKHFTVRVSSNFWYTGGYTTKVQEVHIHPNYNDDTNENDIAVLNVADVGKIRNVKPIPLVSSKSKILVGSSGVVTGWGYTRENGQLSPTLQEVDVNLIDLGQCRKLNAQIGIVTETMLCAGTSPSGHDACQGDSGSPLVIEGVLVGIVSWGYGCGRPGYPGVYTDIYSFRNWTDGFTWDVIRPKSSIISKIREILRL